MLDLMKIGLLRALGMRGEPRQELPFWCDDMAKQHRRIARAARGMNRERVVALCQSVAAIEQRNLPGAIVEVGAGNAVVAAALALMQRGTTCRPIHLFDPSFDMQELVLALMATSDPWEKLVFVPGQVEATLPDEAPRQIALLHLGDIGPCRRPRDGTPLPAPRRRGRSAARRGPRRPDPGRCDLIRRHGASAREAIA